MRNGEWLPRLVRPTSADPIAIAVFKQITSDFSSGVMLEEEQLPEPHPEIPREALVELEQIR